MGGNTPLAFQRLNDRFASLTASWTFVTASAMTLCPPCQRVMLRAGDPERPR